MGTTGPVDIDLATGRPYGLGFPVITIGDMVRLQAHAARPSRHRAPVLRDRRLDGRACRCWSGRRAIPSGCSAPCRSRALGAPLGAEHRVPRGRPPGDHGRPRLAGRQLPRHRSAPDPRPVGGAHGGAHHLSQRGRPASQVRPGAAGPHRRRYGFDADFQVESYLRHQGISFVDRFDANSYLYITRAMDYFDLAASYGGVLANAFRGAATRFCVISFSSDWLFPTAESRELVRALNAVAANVSFCEIQTDRGHDAFLLDEPEFHRVLAGFLEGAASQWRRCSMSGRVRRASIGLRQDLRLIAGSGRAGHAGARRRLRRRRPAGPPRPTKGVDARGIELSQAGVHDCVSRGLAVVQGDADTDLAIYPDNAFDYVILSARPSRRCAGRARCWARCCGSAATASSRSPTTPTGGRAGTWWRAAACRRRAACRSRGTRRPTSIPARSTTSSGCARSSASRSSAAPACRRRAAGRYLGNGWLNNLFSEQALFVLSAMDGVPPL